MTNAANRSFFANTNYPAPCAHRCGFAVGSVFREGRHGGDVYAVVKHYYKAAGTKPGMLAVCIDSQEPSRRGTHFRWVSQTRDEAAAAAYFSELFSPVVDGFAKTEVDPAVQKMLEKSWI